MPLAHLLRNAAIRPISPGFKAPPKFHGAKLKEKLIKYFDAENLLSETQQALDVSYLHNISRDDESKKSTKTHSSSKDPAVPNGALAASSGDVYEYRSPQGRDILEAGDTVEIWDKRQPRTSEYLSAIWNGGDAIKPSESSTPPRPERPEVVERTPTSVSIRWKMPPGSKAVVTGYVVYVNVHHVFYAGLSASCRIEGLQPGKMYTFEVAAQNSRGIGPPSLQLDISTLALDLRDGSACATPKPQVAESPLFDPASTPPMSPVPMATITLSEDALKQEVRLRRDSLVGIGNISRPQVSAVIRRTSFERMQRVFPVSSAQSDVPPSQIPVRIDLTSAVQDASEWFHEQEHRPRLPRIDSSSSELEQLDVSYQASLESPGPEPMAPPPTPKPNALAAVLTRHESRLEGALRSSRPLLYWRRRSVVNEAAEVVPLDAAVAWGKHAVTCDTDRTPAALPPASAVFHHSDATVPTDPVPLAVPAIVVSDCVSSAPSSHIAWGIHAATTAEGSVPPSTPTAAENSPTEPGAWGTHTPAAETSGDHVVKLDPIAAAPADCHSSAAAVPASWGKHSAACTDSEAKPAVEVFHSDDLPSPVEVVPLSSGAGWGKHAASQDVIVVSGCDVAAAKWDPAQSAPDARRNSQAAEESPIEINQSQESATASRLQSDICRTAKADLGESSPADESTQSESSSQRCGPSASELFAKYQSEVENPQCASVSNAIVSHTVPAAEEQGLSTALRDLSLTGCSADACSAEPSSARSCCTSKAFSDTSESSQPAASSSLSDVATCSTTSSPMSSSQSSMGAAAFSESDATQTDGSWPQRGRPLALQSARYEQWVEHRSMELESLCKRLTRRPKQLVPVDVLDDPVSAPLAGPAPLISMFSTTCLVTPHTHDTSSQDSPAADSSQGPCNSTDQVLTDVDNLPARGWPRELMAAFPTVRF